MLALVDCNACYASCEQIFRPDLRGKPIVVLSNNDGCIVTRNKEAKALNLPNLAPYFQIKELLAQHQVHVFSSNYELYGDTSRRIMRLLEDFSDEVEIYSIDEAFLNVGGIQNLHQHGQAIKTACWRQQRMPVCVGIAPTKTLAKLANHIAKKSNKLDGVCVLDDINQWEAVFHKIAVSEIWGIGSRLSKRLGLMGIHSVEDFRAAPIQSLRQQFGVVVERTHRELHGEACLHLETQAAAKKEIMCSRSFSHKLTTLQELSESFADYAVRAAEKLRRQHCLTRRIYVFLQTSRYAPQPYSNSSSQVLLYASNDTRDIITTAIHLLKRLYRPGFAYAKAGIGLLELSDEQHQQSDFFTTQQSPKAKVMMEHLDRINHKYGRGQVFFAAQGIQPTWRMSRDFKSPSYTTRLKDLPLIKL